MKALKQGQSVEVGQNPKEGDEPRPWEMGNGGWEALGGEVNSAPRFDRSPQAEGGHAGEGEIGVSGVEGGRNRNFSAEQGFLESIGATQGNPVVSFPG
jgi:hypothetical protein